MLPFYSCDYLFYHTTLLPRLHTFYPTRLPYTLCALVHHATAHCHAISLIRWRVSPTKCGAEQRIGRDGGSGGMPYILQAIVSFIVKW